MTFQKPRFPIKSILLYGFMPSFLKRWVYRLKGFKIGKKVTIGLGSVICAENVTIGDNTEIGMLTIIRGKTIEIGNHVSIRSLSYLDTPYLAIGDGSQINEQVYVGGLQFPDSKFVLGRNCQVMQMTFINPARGVVVGDDSGIGGYCLIFGHTSWLSQFEGYPVVFEPVEIGKSVSVAWGVFVLPGTRIGDGAVIGAGSMVGRSIPPKCLAMGYPARVISKAPDFPKDISDSEKAEMLKNIVEEMIGVFDASGVQCKKTESGYTVEKTEKRWWRKSTKTARFVVNYNRLAEDGFSIGSNPPEIFLSLWAIPGVLRKAFARRGIMWIDIENKERSNHGNALGEEIAMFLRRYGVRLVRIA